ncbi:hypothetical protein PAAG_05133 [Paracoccidioides lutzii Pb01]|uniref:Alpha/beta hydrolase fold-3 domain-containing protein n=1 Tax=Paracoccidioides lutzii (strain ATCC MYA-826 / Pb01) TaxID=502779 RepID=C1H2Z0_PARBA|nr:hypothetical protein PAAG_05133 [Paracoccidioides lutzii Pb01]EEH34084.2 hypothetical protein PAAG_05133 [Paracoccidioides lutzii Pb01]
MAAILQCIQPLYDACFCPGIPFKYRWRLLTLVPINVLAYSLKCLPWIFSRSYSVVPLRRSPNHSGRALVFTPEFTSNSLRPLHIHVHGGGFIGGIPEMDNAFCLRMVQETGAVVISVSYRLAPRYPFPAAHENVQDAAAYIVENAERLWGANPKLLTLSGCSSGANLALGISQSLSDTEYPVQGALMFDNPDSGRTNSSIRSVNPQHINVGAYCTCVWLRNLTLHHFLSYFARLTSASLHGKKPKPPGFPPYDPLSFLLPLFDVYADSAQSRKLEDPLLNPIIADIRTLPRKMLFIVAGADILLHEVTNFVEHLQKEAELLNSKEIDMADSTGRYEIQSMVFEGQIHGWLDLMSFMIDENIRIQALNAAYDFIRRIHAGSGWQKAS